MNTDLSVLNSTLTMSSREIAELTGKRHNNVLRDIDNLLKTLCSDLSTGYKSTTYVNVDGRQYRQYEMDKDSTICLVAGYDVNARMRIIKRWQELESIANNNNVKLLPFTPYEMAVKQFEGECRVAELMECPKHIILQEIVKSVRKDTGFDFEHYTVMLEPTEIGKYFNIGNGSKVNKTLEGFGLQTIINGEWEPTVTGRLHCQKHAWTKKINPGII